MPPAIPEIKTTKLPNVKPADLLATRLRATLFTLSNRSGTALKNTLDLYYNLICTSPHYMEDGASRFPRPVVFHPTRKERYVLKVGNKDNLIVAHLGGAILGLYDVALRQIAYEVAQRSSGGLPTEKEEKALDRAANLANRRIDLLERVAKFGLDHFAIEGDEEDGYTLMQPAGTAVIESVDDGVAAQATPGIEDLLSDEAGV